MHIRSEEDEAALVVNDTTLWGGEEEDLKTECCDNSEAVPSRPAGVKRPGRGDDHHLAPRLKKE